MHTPGGNKASPQEFPFTHTAIPVTKEGFLEQSFLVALGFQLRALNSAKQSALMLEHIPIHLALVILEMGVIQTICLGCPSTVILPISASQVARITGMSHCLLAGTKF
jgi:hypothetical protein